MNGLNLAKTSCGVLLLYLAATISLSAQGFNVLNSFNGADGACPWAGLVQGTDGNLYGTTSGCFTDGDFGTAFRIAPTGALTTLYSFCAETNCADGEWPEAGLVQGVDGNFYGATNGGIYGDGTIFKMTPGGTLTTLYTFGSQSGDGVSPRAALLQGVDGNFYGTTYFGGTYCAGFSTTCGTVFKMTPSGVLTILHSFNGADGDLPSAPLVQAQDGNFYGTTVNGGNDTQPWCGVYGCGVVFKINPNGALTTIYKFCSQSGCPDGQWPTAGLVQAADGNLYGTASYGGSGGLGTIFRITPAGTLTALYSFCSEGWPCRDGAYPNGLIQASDGNFYGTTSGSGSGGTVFKMTPDGTLTTLRVLHGADGSYPKAGLLQDTNGRFYGTASSGGSGSDGTVFTVSPGLGLFVETQPGYGKAGAFIKILGTNLAGATSVTFNGVPAVFIVEARSVIRATVPVGATTGTVQVTTASGTLSSNVLFRVK